ncbi:helix-turn-helix domain-containing protein [Pedobacter lusitanus]|uniref:helix-turn-helix domain-containing protein n=1 Tax=Pedobacter lusitanus TaxID=1503925 RepID=UPI001F2C35F4|nr:AraC family transcriptional regulator [Pedobacter lusitanus]
MEMSKYSKPRKIILLTGIVICLLSVFIIFPVEYSKSYFIEDYILTYTGLTMATLSILYGLTGRSFIKYLLFDFSEPYKVDLEEFMNQNYMFNVSVETFGRLTGRSLSGFKRDFAKTFGTTPKQWLREKRLDEAYYMIKHKKQKPADFYLDLGFENLSHFYFAFKQRFGMTTSEV